MSVPRRGCLYWARLDRRRPVLVVSPGYRNAGANDVLVVPCTTRGRLAPTHVALPRGAGGAPHASVLKCEQITNLAKDALDDAPLGPPLDLRAMRAVERAILIAVGIPVAQ